MTLRRSWGSLKDLNAAALASMVLKEGHEKAGEDLGLATLCGGGGASMTAAQFPSVENLGQDRKEQGTAGKKKDDDHRHIQG